MKIFAVIPCFNVGVHIIELINQTLKHVDKIVIIDDCCPLKTSEIVEKEFNRNDKVHVIKNKKNLGVGGAVKEGYKYSMAFKPNFLVKLDGDGQMDPEHIKQLLKKAIEDDADYIKGNRFFFSKDIFNMSIIRIIGNIGVSFLGKISTGYWKIFDFTNGYTLIKAQTLKKINLTDLKNNYFFETDMLFHLNLIDAKVRDIYIPAKYSKVKSNLKIRKIFLYFFFYNLTNFIKRIYKKF